MTDIISQYKELLSQKKQLELKLASDEARLAEKVSKKEEHIKSTLSKYNVNTIEELDTLKTQKEEEAKKVVEEIRASGESK